MKYKKLLTVATIAGLAIGGVTVASAASAQSYGDGERTESTESDSTDSTIETEASAEGGVVLVQDTPADESEPQVEGEEADRRHDGRRGRGGCNLEAAAEAIGIEESDLKTALENGDTIADVAVANGVDVDAVVDAMVDAKTERIDAKVTSGRITAEEAAEKLAELETRTANRVNGVEAALGA